jgi:hypothetical protein
MVDYIDQLKNTPVLDARKYATGSSTGGIQEAINALPAAGGDVVVASNVTLTANVTDGGKTWVRVIRQPGVVITGAYTILGGTYSSKAQIQVFQKAPTWASLTSLHNGTVYDIGGFPQSREFGFDITGAAQALVGRINITDDGQTNAFFASGVSGYGRAERQSADAVGVFGGGEAAGPFTQAWGANFVVQNGTTAIGGSNLVGVETDVNNSASGADAPAIILGYTAVANIISVPSGYSAAYKALKTDVSLPWDSAFTTDNGATSVAFAAGTIAATTNPSNSQLSTWASRTGGGTTLTGSQFLDSNNILWIRASSAITGIVALDPGGAGSPSFSSYPTYNQSNVPMRQLPTTFAGLPGTPTEGMTAVVTDATVDTWGTTVAAGGGALRVMVYYNGTAWTVMAK